MIWSRTLVALGLLASGALSVGVANDEGCNGQWIEHANFGIRHGCLIMPDGEVKFTQISFDLTQTELGLFGPTDDGIFPDYGSTDTGTDDGPTHDFLNNELQVYASIGYPISPEIPIPYGLLRSDGMLIADRDLESRWLKTAIFCVNESQRNSNDAGSRVVIFNAFEDGQPIVLNSRIQDEQNCLDAVQTGPRVVEYIGKRGVLENERRNRGQRYSVFSQGNGDKDGNGFFGYFTYFNEDVNLYDVQEYFLKEDSGKGESMRVAVVMTSGQFSSLSWKDNAGQLQSVGKTKTSHPIYIGF